MIERRVGYKYTDGNDQTRWGTQWGPGVEHDTRGQGELCTPGWLHLYDSPEVAALRDPVDGLYTRQPGHHLWRVEWWGWTRDERGLKRGAEHVRTVERVPELVLTTDQRVRAAIYCAQAVLSRGTAPAWWLWADGWLAGRRERTPAIAAVRGLTAISNAAADAAAAAHAADYAADAACAAIAAAHAADYAADAYLAPLDLVFIVRRAIADESKEKGVA